MWNPDPAPLGIVRMNRRHRFRVTIDASQGLLDCGGTKTFCGRVFSSIQALFDRQLWDVLRAGFRSRWKKLHRDRVQAVALPGGRRPVGEHVPQVAIATLAANLGANHAITRVLNVADMVRIEGFKEARPPGAGFELGAGSEQGQAAQPAAVNAVLFVVEQAAAKRRLGPMIQQNPAFFGAEPLGQTAAFRIAERAEFITRFRKRRLGLHGSLGRLVDGVGLEPTTPALRTRCSPN